MNLEQAVHQQWALSETLTDLLPAEDLKTGRFFGDSLPYATIVRRKNRTAFRTNSADAMDEVTLDVHVWHDDYDAGRAVVQQAKATFDRSDFALSGGDKVVQMRRVDDSARQHDDGTWQFTIEFMVQVYLISGI